MEETISVRDYARQMGVTMHTVYMKLWGGQLKGVKLYGRWQIIVGDDRTNEGTATSQNVRSQSTMGLARVIEDCGAQAQLRKSGVKCPPDSADKTQEKKGICDEEAHD